VRHAVEIAAYKQLPFHVPAARLVPYRRFGPKLQRTDHAGTQLRALVLEEVMKRRMGEGPGSVARARPFISALTNDPPMNSHRRLESYAIARTLSGGVKMGPFCTERHSGMPPSAMPNHCAVFRNPSAPPAKENIPPATIWDADCWANNRIVRARSALFPVPGPPQEARRTPKARTAIASPEAANRSQQQPPPPALLPPSSALLPATLFALIAPVTGLILEPYLFFFALGHGRGGP